VEENLVKVDVPLIAPLIYTITSTLLAEPKGSTPLITKPTIGHNLEPDPSTAHPHMFSKIHLIASILIFQVTAIQDFLYTFLVSPS
jgi:hypothetical protein